MLLTRDSEIAFAKLLKNIKYFSFDQFLSPDAVMVYLKYVHKPHCPLRYFISSVGTGTHSLARWLASLLSPYLGVYSSAYLRNSLVFILKFRNFTRYNSLYNFRTVRLDVTILFTSVPLEDVVNFLVEQYNANVMHYLYPLIQYFHLSVCAS